MGLGTHTQHMYAYTHTANTHTQTHLYASPVPYILMQSYTFTNMHMLICSHLYTSKTDAHVINNYIRIRWHGCNGKSKTFI